MPSQVAKSSELDTQTRLKVLIVEAPQTVRRLCKCPQGLYPVDTRPLDKTARSQQAALEKMFEV